MPTALTKTATIIGIDTYIIEVEADVSIGMGVFNVVGLPYERIKQKVFVCKLRHGPRFL